MIVRHTPSQHPRNQTVAGTHPSEVHGLFSAAKSPAILTLSSRHEDKGETQIYFDNTK